MQKQVILLTDLMASLKPIVKQEKQKIQHMRKSAMRRRPRVRSTRGTAGGGCGRRAVLVILHPMCLAMATSFTMAIMSTMLMMRFGPLCI